MDDVGVRYRVEELRVGATVQYSTYSVYRPYSNACKASRRFLPPKPHSQGESAGHGRGVLRRFSATRFWRLEDRRQGVVGAWLLV